MLSDKNARAAREVKGQVRTEYEEGELVWLFHNLVKPGLVKKLAHLWHGPYRIAEKLSAVAYKLDINGKSPRIYPVVHISRLKPYVPRELRPTELLENVEPTEFDEALLPEDSWEPTGTNEYEVQTILAHRYVQWTRNARQRKQYLIKWKGYVEPTWGDEADLSCGALLFEYMDRARRQARAAAAQTAEEDDCVV